MAASSQESNLKSSFQFQEQDKNKSSWHNVTLDSKMNCPTSAYLQVSRNGLISAHFQVYIEICNFLNSKAIWGTRSPEFRCSPTTKDTIDWSVSSCIVPIWSSQIGLYQADIDIRYQSDISQKKSISDYIGRQSKISDINALIKSIPFCSSTSDLYQQLAVVHTPTLQVGILLLYYCCRLLFSLNNITWYTKYVR